MMPTKFGIAGYVAPIVDITSSYALFQAANNTDITTARPEAVATAMRVTFAVTAITIAIAIAVGSRRHRARKPCLTRPVVAGG